MDQTNEDLYQEWYRVMNEADMAELSRTDGDEDYFQEKQRKLDEFIAQHEDLIQEFQERQSREAHEFKMKSKETLESERGFRLRK